MGHALLPARLTDNSQVSPFYKAIGAAVNSVPEGLSTDTYNAGGLVNVFRVHGWKRVGKDAVTHIYSSIVVKGKSV